MARTALGLVVTVLAVAALATGLGVVLVTSQAAEITAKYVQGALPLDPDAQLWRQLGTAEVTLTAQLIVYPVSLDTTPRTLRVAAAHNATHLAIYIEWSDPTKDVAGTPGNISSFPDAVAVQFPVNATSLPYICMGDTASPVNIAYWRAGERVENLVAGSAYGQQPGQREALGLQSTPTSPIEMLPPEAQVWTAEARYENGTWKVVMMRPTGSVHPMVPEINPGSTISVAFANWEGSLGERGGSKPTSGWYSLTLEPVTAPKPAAPQTETVTKEVVPPALKSALIGLIAALAIAVLALVLFTARSRASTSR